MKVKEVKKVKIGIFVFLTLLVGTLLAQDKQNKQETVYKLKYTTAGLKLDERFKVGNFSFSRRYANDGTGEYLEVFFDLKNYTDEPISLEVLLIGIWEENRVDEKQRKRIPYPKWRTRDFDTEVFDIKYATSIPAIDKFKVNPNLKGSRDFPSMMDYVNYISNTPDIGIPFTLPGLEKSKIVSVLGKDYEIHGKNLEAMFVGRLYTKFSLKYYFFNHLGIVIRDRESKRVVFRQFFKFRKPPKAY